MFKELGFILKENAANHAAYGSMVLGFELWSDCFSRAFIGDGKFVLLGANRTSVYIDVHALGPSNAYHRRLFDLAAPESLDDIREFVTAPLELAAA